MFELETFIVPTGVCIIIMSTSVSLGGTLRCLVSLYQPKCLLGFFFDHLLCRLSFSYH